MDDSFVDEVQNLVAPSIKQEAPEEEQTNFKYLKNFKYWYFYGSLIYWYLISYAPEAGTITSAEFIIRIFLWPLSMWAPL